MVTYELEDALGLMIVRRDGGEVASSCATLCEAIRRFGGTHGGGTADRPRVFVYQLSEDVVPPGPRERKAIADTWSDVPGHVRYALITTSPIARATFGSINFINQRRTGKSLSQQYRKVFASWDDAMVWLDAARPGTSADLRRLDARRKSAL